MFAAKLRHGCTGLGLLEHGDDLAVVEVGLLRGASSEKRTRKFHFRRQLIGGKITVGNRLDGAHSLHINTIGT